MNLFVSVLTTVGQTPNAIWRFDPQENSLIPAIPRSDVIIPKKAFRN